MSENEQPKQICKKCNTEYADGSNFCYFCGKPKNETSGRMLIAWERDEKLINDPGTVPIKCDIVFFSHEDTKHTRLAFNVSKVDFQQMLFQQLSETLNNIE